MRIRYTLALAAVAACVFFLPSSETFAGSNSPKTCCTGMRGNIDGQGIINLVDLSAFVSYFLYGTYTLPCPDAANVNGQGGIDLPDLSMLVAYLIGEPTTLIPCPGDTAYVNDTVRIAALNAVTQFVSTVDSLPVDSFNQRVLTFIQSRPEFVESGISAEGGNVWALFSDGVAYFISNAYGQSLDTLPGDSLPPDTGSAPQFLSRPNDDKTARAHPFRAEAGSEDDLPKSIGYRIINTVGSAFPAAPTTVNRLRSWLKENHYFDMGPATTVNALKQIADEGVIIYFGHGGYFKTVESDNPTREYGIWTDTPAEYIDQLKPYTNDFIFKRLCYATCPIDWNPVTHKFIEATRIGITSKFISWYWHALADNAIVIINACSSDAYPEFRNAIQSKNGPAYFGWDRSISCKGACYTTEYLVDRLLGCNHAYPKENPKQRSFPVSEVWADLTAKGLHVQPSGDTLDPTPSTFHYHAGSSNFGLLAPSIMFASVNDNTDKLTLVGNFGSDPGSDGKVTVNGVERPVNSWNTNEIVCDIASFGPGSAGPVKVMVRGNLKDLTPLTFRESNTVNLTEWRGQMQFTRDELGSLHIAGNYGMHFRADVQDYRVSPATAPTRLFHPFCGTMKDVDASVSASGSYQYCEGDLCDLFEWLGNANVPLLDLSNPGGPSEFYFQGDIDVDAGMIRMNFDNQSRSGLIQHTTVDGPDTHYTLTDTLMETGGTEYGLFDDNINEQYFLFLDHDFNIASGTRTYMSDFPFISIGTGTKASLKMVWNGMLPSFPPDPNDAR